MTLYGLYPNQLQMYREYQMLKQNLIELKISYLQILKQYCKA